MKKANLLITLSTFVFCLNAQAGLLFNYSQLALKDLDQMNKLVTDKVRESKKSASGQEVPLKEALQAVYSRPNEDRMIDKVVSPLRSGLDDLDAWEKTVSQLTDEAINALKNPKAFKPVVQVTYIVFLENLLSQIKPYLQKGNFEFELADRVKNAKIQVSKEAADERKIRTMKTTSSPSELAERILAQAAEKAASKPAPVSESSSESKEDEQ